MKKKEVSNKDFLSELKKTKSKGFNTNVIAYYENKNIYIEDDFIIYTFGQFFTIVENDFEGNPNSNRSKFDNQIYKITGNSPSFRQGEFINESKENKIMKKSIKEKRISTEDKIQALAEYKGVEIDEVEEGYDENHFEVDGEEWIVADYDTAYDLAVVNTQELFDDLGIELVNKNVQEYFLGNEEYCSFPWKDDMHESNLNYANDIASESSSSGYASRLVEEAIDRKVIKEKDCFENEDGELDYEDTDELAEMLADDMDDDYDSMSEWFESIYGRNWVKEMKDTLENYLDYSAMAEYVVDSDGIANSLAGYDNREVELTKDLYGYRTN